MSITGNIIVAETRLELVEGVPYYLTHYILRDQAPNGHTDGQVSSPVGLQTESTFNLTVQQACADRANLEGNNTEDFTAADVYGGRI